MCGFKKSVLLNLLRVLLQKTVPAVILNVRIETKSRDYKINTKLIKLRDVCGEYFVAHPVRIGGEGHTMQIAGRVFTRRKYNRGRMIREQWVFGGIDTKTKAGFMVPVDRRDAATLLPIIQQFILPGTTIVSDLWGAYNTVGNLGYAHLTVNHSANFVDPITFAHTKLWKTFGCARSSARKKGDLCQFAAVISTGVYVAANFWWRPLSEYRSGD